jgi:hypothetical protein
MKTEIFRNIKRALIKNSKVKLKRLFGIMLFTFFVVYMLSLGNLLKFLIFSSDISLMAPEIAILGILTCSLIVPLLILILGFKFLLD